MASLEKVLFILVLIFIAGLVAMLLYSANQTQVRECKELSALGFRTSLENRTFIHSHVCYIYLADGRKVFYDDIKNNINVEFAKN